MNISRLPLPKQVLQSPPPREDFSSSSTGREPLDTVELNSLAQCKDSGRGAGSTLGALALLGVAAIGVTGCVPQEPSNVEVTTTTTTTPTTTTQGGSERIDLRSDSPDPTVSETPKSPSLRSDGTLEVDLGNGTTLRSDGTVGFDTGHGSTINSDGTVDFDLGNGISINSDGEFHFSF